MKICTRCKQNIEDSFFRVRQKKYKNTIHSYRNSTCKQCDAADARKRYNDKKSDQVFMEQNRVRVRAYRIENIDLIKSKMKSKRTTKEYKEYVRGYYQKNAEKIRSQHRKVCQNSAERISLSYLKTRVYFQTGIRAHEITEDHPLIIIKQLEIINSRIKKEAHEQRNPTYSQIT